MQPQTNTMNLAQSLNRPRHAASFRCLAGIVLLLAVLCSSFTLALAQDAANSDLSRASVNSDTARRERRAEPPADPAALLRTARYIYVRSLSLLIEGSDVENKLRRHADFQRLGMLITRNEEDADLILEVRRGVLTKFVFTAVDPRTGIVVASGKLSSLGGTVDGKVAKLFMKQVLAAHGETAR
jgi:hypothetical protein